VISKVWILPIDFPAIPSHIRLNIAKAPPNWVQNWAIGKQLIYPDSPPPHPPPTSGTYQAPSDSSIYHSYPL
ncbi:uncharacterized protein K444DRAFT_606668, partial [Hyaloscypha bicolor E]